MHIARIPATTVRYCACRNSVTQTMHCALCQCWVIWYMQDGLFREDTTRTNHSTGDITNCYILGGNGWPVKSKLLFQPNRDLAGLCTVFTVPTALWVLDYPAKMDFQHRAGGKTGSGGVASTSESNRDRRERLRQLALETIDINKDPYFMKNHLGSYECKLCLTLHNNEVRMQTKTQCLTKAFCFRHIEQITSNLPPSFYRAAI